MPELRWTLLIIGVLFIAILAWWERRRPHQASRQAPHIGTDSRPVVNNDPPWGPDVEPAAARASHVVREPTLTLPEIRTEPRTREPIAPRELPIVEIEDAIEPDEEVSDEKISEELEEISEEISHDASPEVARKVSQQVEEEAEELDAEELDAEELDAEEELEDEQVTVVAGSAPAEPLPPAVSNVKPIVDWPPEEQRKVVALRLVARPPERFRGALVRQALFAEGFTLGDFDIFHKPDAQNRAVLSAASLTKPGTFDLETMDIQRYVGLNLFAVLPGPKSPRKTFEDLLLTARMLNERLEGALQDQKGGPLTPMRIQALRDALEAEEKS
jgi:cell division protein ZipA